MRLTHSAICTAVAPKAVRTRRINTTSATLGQSLSARKAANQRTSPRVSESGVDQSTGGEPSQVDERLCVQLGRQASTVGGFRPSFTPLCPSGVVVATCVACRFWRCPPQRLANRDSKRMYVPSRLEHCRCLSFFSPLQDRHRHFPGNLCSPRCHIRADIRVTSFEG